MRICGADGRAHSRHHLPASAIDSEFADVGDSIVLSIFMLGVIVIWAGPALTQFNGERSLGEFQ
jgi:hypothetical protein